MVAEVPQPAVRPAIVLFVEDDVLIRAVVSETLRESGLTVIEAPNADATMMLLKADARIDYLLTDVRMDGRMDGLELAKWVSEHHPNVGIIVTSSDPMLAGGVPQFAYMGKPYRPLAVAEYIKSAWAAKG